MTHLPDFFYRARAPGPAPWAGPAGRPRHPTASHGMADLGAAFGAERLAKRLRRLADIAEEAR